MTGPRPLPSGEPFGWFIAIVLGAFVVVSYTLGICAIALHFFS